MQITSTVFAFVAICVHCIKIIFQKYKRITSALLYIFGWLHLTRICSTSELNLFKPAKIYQKHISFQDSSRHARWRREETLYKGQSKRFDCMSWINTAHTAESALASKIQHMGIGTGDAKWWCALLHHKPRTDAMCTVMEER